MKKQILLILIVSGLTLFPSSCRKSDNFQKEERFSEKSDLPWYKTTYRWAQTNFTEDDPVKSDIEFWRKQWKRTNTQGVIVNCGGIVAYYPSEYGLQYRAKYLGEQDFFRKVSDAATEDGIKVVARMDINRATKEFFDVHPDWFCRYKNGDPIMAEDRYYSCVNSGYYKEFIPKILTEIIEKYHPAGFVDNSWKGLDRHTICYCENCKNKFMKASGLSLPEAVSWEDPVYCEWVRWSYGCRMENWDLFNETTKRVGGDDCLWFGMVHADPNSGSFADLKEVLNRSVMVFADHQARDYNGFQQNAVNGTLLRLASPDEQLLVPESMAHYVNRSPTFRLASNPMEETQLWMIEGFAGGISPWFHYVGGGLNDRRQLETSVSLYQWHTENEQYLYNRVDMANVGIVWSQENAVFYGRDDAGEKVTFPWKGFCQALSMSRIPFLPINVHDIKKYSDRIHTLILPDVAIMPDEAIDAVCDFVKNGGNIVVTGVTATLDKNGEPSKNNKLWELLNLSFSGEKKGIFEKTSSGWGNYVAHSYFRLPVNIPRHEILSGFEDTDILPFGGGLQVVRSSGNLKPLMSYIPPFPIYPPEFSWIRGEEPEICPLFAGTLPSGGKAVYFAGDIDRCYGRSSLPDHGKLLANAIKWAAGDRFPLKLEGPGYIDCKLYKQDDRIILHLVNLSGANRINYLDEYLPVGPFTVMIDDLGIAPEKAFLTVAKKNIPLKIKDGTIEVHLDKINDFEMLVFE